MSIENFKNAFDATSGLTHLNNAGLAPISRPARDRIVYWADRFYKEGFYTDADYMQDVALTRSRLSKLIGCQAQEIAFFVSTAGAINQFAFQIGLEPQDEVVMWDQEYSSMLYPFQFACKQSGATLKLVSSESNLATPTEKYLQAIGPKTRVAAFSWVQFSSGAQMDVKRVIEHCKKHGILVFIDVIQGIGVKPFDLWHLGVDAVVGGSHKWLVSPVGVGYLALRSELVTKMKPHGYGSSTFGTCDDPSNFACEPKVDASKFEPGSKQVLEITAMGASIQLILDVGLTTIHKEAMRLTHDLLKKVKDLGLKVKSPFTEGHDAPMVNVIFEEALQVKVLEALKQKKINFALRGGGVRFSPHAFNSDQDIDLLVTTIKNSLP